MLIYYKHERISYADKNYTIDDFPDILHTSFFQRDWPAALKVNIQFKVNKVKVQFTDVYNTHGLVIMLYILLTFFFNFRVSNLKGVQVSQQL